MKTQKSQNATFTIPLSGRSREVVEIQLGINNGHLAVDGHIVTGRHYAELASDKASKIFDSSWNNHAAHPYGSHLSKFIENGYIVVESIGQVIVLGSNCTIIQATVTPQQARQIDAYASHHSVESCGFLTYNDLVWYPFALCHDIDDVLSLVEKE